MAGGAVRVMNEVREAYGVVIPPFCRCAAAVLLAKCRVTRQVPRYSPSSYQSRALREVCRAATREHANPSIRWVFGLEFSIVHS